MSGWAVAAYIAVAAAVLFGIKQWRVGSRQKTEALRQSWRDRGEVPVWLLLIALLAAICIAGWLVAVAIHHTLGAL